MIQKVVSGGQIGVDQSALLAARDAGVPTGGWAPRGWRTSAGPAPWLADFGLVEHASPAYPPRTHANVRDSDGTVIFGDPLSRGSTLTAGYARALRRPLLVLRWPSEDETYVSALRAWAAESGVCVLNVAGNREEKNPGVFAACYWMLRGVLG